MLDGVGVAEEAPVLVEPDPDLPAVRILRDIGIGVRRNDEHARDGLALVRNRARAGRPEPNEWPGLAAAAAAAAAANKTTYW